MFFVVVRFLSLCAKIYLSVKIKTVPALVLLLGAPPKIGEREFSGSEPFWHLDVHLVTLMGLSFWFLFFSRFFGAWLKKLLQRDVFGSLKPFGCGNNEYAAPD